MMNYIEILFAGM